MPDVPEVSGPDQDAFRRITLFGILSGLCPLIPIPFLDDWALRWVRKKMVVERLRRRGLLPSREQIEVLAGAETKPLFDGCLRTLFLLPLIKISIYLVRKVIRKILVILTLKEGVDSFSRTFHEGYLLHRALVTGVLHPSWLDEGRDGVTGLRWVIEETCRRIDPRPIHQLVKRAFSSSRRLLFRASRTLGQVLRWEWKRDRRNPGAESSPDAREVIDREEELLEGMLTRLTRTLLGEASYLKALEAAFDTVLEEARERSDRQRAAAESQRAVGEESRPLGEISPGADS